MSGEPESRDLVSRHLRCFLCESRATLTLPASEPLTTVFCPTCGRAGAMTVTSPMPPRVEPIRVGKYDEPPDDLGDEELLARRPWSRPWNAT